MRLKGKVRWLKTMEGGCDLPMLGASKRAANALRKLGDDIAGGPDAVALYIRQNPRQEYHTTGHLPGAIAGVLCLAPMPLGCDVTDYGEDANFPVGWPVADLSLTQGPRLRNLVIETCGEAAWRKLYPSLQGGRPLHIDEPPYGPLGRALSDFYR